MATWEYRYWCHDCDVKGIDTKSPATCWNCGKEIAAYGVTLGP